MSELLKYYPASKPSDSVKDLQNKYTQIFTKAPQQPLALIQPIVKSLNYKEFLVEVPAEKQGIHPHQKQIQKQQQQQQQQQQQINIQKGKFVKAAFDDQTSPSKVKVFQICGLCEDPAKKAWFYKDSSNEVQGPFTNREMDILLLKQEVDAQTRVALDSLDKFVKIDKIIKIVNSHQEKQQIKPIPVKIRDNPIMTPFLQSQLASQDNVKVWYYKSQGSAEQIGPLSTIEMDRLWQTMSIHEDTKIAFEDTNKFVKLEKILKLAQKSIDDKRKKEEEEKKQKEEEEKKEKEKGPVNIQIDYTKVKPRDTGAWDEEKPQAKVVVTVVNKTDRKNQGKQKQRGEDLQKGARLNKSMHVEGQQGNLYDKTQLNQKQKLHTIQEKEQQEKEHEQVQQEKQVSGKDNKQEMKQEQVQKKVEEEDEWLEVKPQKSANKKKQSKLSSQVNVIPGLGVQQQNIQQRNKQSQKQNPIVVNKNQNTQDNQDDDDGWMEVTK